MVMSDVKEEEVVSRVTKMAAELHFSGGRSSISGMKVPVEVTHWSWRTLMTKKKVDRRVCQDWPKLFQSLMYSMHLLFVILITQMKT